MNSAIRMVQICKEKARTVWGSRFFDIWRALVTAMKSGHLARFCQLLGLGSLGWMTSCFVSPAATSAFAAYSALTAL